MPCFAVQAAMNGLTDLIPFATLISLEASAVLEKGIGLSLAGRDADLAREHLQRPEAGRLLSDSSTLSSSVSALYSFSSALASISFFSRTATESFFPMRVSRSFFLISIVGIV